MDAQFDLTKQVAVGADHAGFDYKQKVIAFLEKHHIPYKDFGTQSADSVDYPDFAHPVATSVESGESAWGILLCGSANGVAITANKHQHIRAAICWEPEIASLARQHNNANVICLPSRFVSIQTALEMVETFMNGRFEGGRHERRVEKIACQ